MEHLELILRIISLAGFVWWLRKEHKRVVALEHKVFIMRRLRIKL